MAQTDSGDQEQPAPARQVPVRQAAVRQAPVRRAAAVRQAALRQVAPPSTPATAWRRRRADAAVGLCAVLLVGVCHQVVPVLTQPYWLDEAWVALSGKASFMDLPWVAASSPIGWTLLVASLPPYEQIQRLVPLAFLAATAVAGYRLGRALGWSSGIQSIISGSAGMAAALLLPAQFARHDLKQYTADAAIAVLLLALAAWAESAWSARRLLVLGATIVVGMLFSHPAAFVGSAVLGGLLVAATLSRRWDRLGRATVLTAATSAGMALIYTLVDRHGDTAELSAYWSPYFPSVAGLPSYLVRHLGELRPALGMAWPLFLVLAALGVVTVAWLGRPATAVALVALPMIVATAGVTRMYPLLDQRTSQFLLVTGAVLAAIGVAGAATAVFRFARWLSPHTRCVAVGGVVGVALAGFAAANWGVLAHPPRPGEPGEDVRSQVGYVAARRGPADTVLVNLSGQYGFAYYWSADRPEFHRGGIAATGWRVAYPPPDRIVVAAGRDEASVREAVAAADALAGPHGRIWLVRSHVTAGEADAWQQVLSGRQVATVHVGPEPVVVLTARSPAAESAVRAVPTRTR